MSRRLLSLFAFAVLSPGCVPVTEPVGEIAKAEPDKNLIGDWKEDSPLLIDVPDVKGNPKGLMRAVNDGQADNPKQVLWFFTTTIGKHTYANIILTRSELTSPPFHKEGEYAKWLKEPKKQYFVFRYRTDGKTLTIDAGDKTTVDKMMAAEKIKANDDGFFETSAGWLAKYLDKHDPDKIFDASNKRTYNRPKK